MGGSSPGEVTGRGTTLAATALAGLLDTAQDALLLVDTRGAVVHCNQAAMRLLGCEPGHGLADLERTLGASALAWLHQVRDAAAGLESTQLRLEDGRAMRLELRRIDAALWALGVRVDTVAPPPAAAELARIGTGAVRDMVRLLWDSPFPATLQGPDFRLVSVNQAYVDFCGRSRESLIGMDPVDLQPEEERMFTLAARERLRENPHDPALPRLVERRMLDAGGRERWSRLSRRLLTGAGGEPLYLSVLQDCTAEHVAREQADRTMRELDEWFDLSPVGMVLYDDSGLLVRTNAAFEALVGQVPVVLADAAPALQELLAWHDGAPSAELVPGAPPVECRTTLALPDGRRQRLLARVRSFAAGGFHRRVMAVVEDRSLEDERDLAQLEIGALIDTAGIGVATFEESRGWLPSLGRADGKQAARAGAGLQAISREIVEPESLPEYERLQRALKRGERAEVRYGVRHPELGPRWLLTRVEPGRLASGGRTTSVVTLDVTEQEQAQRRNAQLLRELSTILDSTSAGIAYLRGNTLVRCNQRFERMLGVSGGKVAGASLEELFADARAMRASLAALDDGGAYETEFRGGADGAWYSLSVRRAAGSGDEVEAVAVLTDITRLKSQQLELEGAREQVVRQADRTRAILDSVLVGIVTVGEGGIEWMNRSARRMFGGELADFIGSPIAVVATPEPDHPLRRTHYLDTLAEGQAEAFECKLTARDGREFWVVGNAVMTGREDSGGRQLTFALLDIERRRQAEVRIAQAQASLARIIETAPLAIALLDARDLRVQQLNQMAATFAGRPIADALGRALPELFDPGFVDTLTADLRHALATRDVVRRELQHAVSGEPRVWDARYVPLAAAGDAPDQVLIVASDVTEQRAADEARLAAAIAQRDMLVKEVHHRIKNNLQGVAGLMQQIAQRRPEVAPVISEAIGQVQAIAQVYGLQVGAAGPLRVKSVIEAIAASVQRMFGRTIEVDVRGEAPHRWALPEAESIPIALTINELLTNALKHSADREGEVRCTLTCGDADVRIAIANPGRLPDGFELARVPGGVSGLGLVRALMPRRNATLTLAQDGACVVAAIALLPPGVTLLDRL